MNLDDLKTKKVIILGLGKEGLDTFRFLRRLFPDKSLGIADKLKFEQLQKETQKFIRAEKCSRHIRTYLGENYLKSLKSYDIIIKSPGIPFKILPRTVLGKITSQTEIFFENCPGKIVGITGTKGKSTTASMIYEILKAGGIKAHLVGNIGKPALNLLFSATSKDVYIYELSSHQLSNLKKSPHVAVLLNIYPEHLDYYRSFKEYVNAKANIARYQTKNDYLVYNSTDKIIKEIAGKSKTEPRDNGAKKASFLLSPSLALGRAKVKMRTQFSSPAKKIPIKEEYYELDKAAAGAVGKIFKIPPKIIEKAIKRFKYLPHRLELVGTFKGITFYNDALATIPEATMAAMKTLGGKVETIMLGGFDRKINFKKLAQKVLQSRIKTVILFPTTGKKIWQDIVRQKKKKEIKKGRVPNHFFVDNMKEAVKLAYQHTKTGQICLLSTASSSFSIFKDYKEKGDLFKKYVRKYAQ